ncbi:hypothetical protein D3C74_363240 [compost metagenome]
MIFQGLTRVLVEQLIDGDELTGVDQLIRQYRIGGYGNEIRQLFARGDSQLQFLSVLIVIGRIPSIFVLHTQRFEHPAIVHVIFFGISLHVFLRHQYRTELDGWVIFSFSKSSFCFR